MPGVPHEMRTMVGATVIPDLQRRAGVRAVIRSRVLRTWGHTESGLAELLGPRIVELDLLGNPTLAFQASGIEGIKVRITAKAADDAAADAILAEEDARLRPLLGDYVFGLDEQTMELVVLDMLRERGLSLAVAELVTGGLVGARLTAIAGAGDVLRGGVVAYASDVKFALLGVPEGPVVTAAAAEAMAAGVRRLLNADIGLATTGVAGPTEQEGQRVGTVFVGLALGDEVQSALVRLPGDRNRIRQYGVISLLNFLRLSLLADRSG